MSAPLRMTPSQVTSLGEFLDLISKASRATGCVVGAYGSTDVRIAGGESALSITWSADDGTYNVDDRSGS